MSATFGLSSLGKSIVTAEGPLTPVRVALTALTLLVGLCALFHVSVHLRRLLRTPPGSQPRRVHALLLLYAAYLVHLVIHTAHFADNIARPVDYHEPEWLYVGYLISTMEITFFFNIPTTVGGAICAVALLKAYDRGDDRLPGSDRSTKRWSRGMLIYASMSVLTLMHYNVEQPASYAPEVNFTIAGEGVAALALAVIVIILQSRDCCSAREDHASGSESAMELEVLATAPEDNSDRDGGTARAGMTHVRRRSGAGSSA